MMDDERIKAAAMMLDHMDAAEHAATVREMAAEIERLRADRDAAVAYVGRIGQELGHAQAEADRLRADAERLCLALDTQLPHPLCRDCADSNGICANNGIVPCDPTAATEWARSVRDGYARKMADAARGE